MAEFTLEEPEEMSEFSIERQIEQFEAVTKDAGRVQRETLRKILEENANTEYLQSLGLGGRTDPASFKSCVPLVSHKDLEPYIRRIADGDTSPILTAKPITLMSLSSGTTERKPKLLPFNEKLMQNAVQTSRTSFAFRNREFPIVNGKALQFIYSSKQSVTKGGLIVRTVTTNVYSCEKFKLMLRDTLSRCCSPDEVIFSPDFRQSLYCHLLCGLIYSNEVQFISSIFAHSIVNAFRTLQTVWEELCSDIREGILSSRITIPSMRAAISKLLYPNPGLADSLYNKFVHLNNWYGVIPEVWPNAKYVLGIMTGSMEPYVKKLRHYAGNLPLICLDYGSSEGNIGTNVNPKLGPEVATFAVLPNTGYFEFLPLSEKFEDQDNYSELEPLGLTEVEIGKEYEVIITSFAGLYRYRLGDVVKVARFHNSTPELKFVGRRSLIPNIYADKNTEKDLQLAVEEATKLLAVEKIEVVDFTSHVDECNEPGHYVIFWELSADAGDDVLSSCCNCLERAFVNLGYVGSWKTQVIGLLELRVVRRGTFQKILDHYLGLGVGVSQFKTPRFVGQSNEKVLKILCSNVSKSYFSTAYD